MKQSFRRFLSAVLVITLLLGMIPVYGTATEKEGYLSPDDGKMDTSYLRISMEKYGSTVSASSLASSKGTSVLEYTQWQMTATFIRVLDGKVEAEQDVTDDCTWASSDSTGQTLVVSESGLVTAYRASDTTHVITASYEGFVAVTGADGATAVQDKTFVANMPMAVVQLNIPKEDEEALRCLAFTFLANNEWSVLYEGAIISDWVDSQGRYFLNPGPSISAPHSDQLFEKLNVEAHENSAKVFHFLSAAAGNAVIESLVQSTAGDVRAIVFRCGTQRYMAYAYAEPNTDKTFVYFYGEKENHGNRRFEISANLSYSKEKKLFEQGIDLYRNEAENENAIRVTGQYFGGTVAQYVSYITGCRAITFNSPSPLQYVVLNDFDNLCKYFCMENRTSYVAQYTYAYSTAYRIEPGYKLLNRYWADEIPVQYDITQETLSFSKTPFKPESVQKIWNRWFFLGSNGADTYNDDESLIKLVESCQFGGAGDDSLKLKYAQKSTIDAAGTLSTVLDNWKAISDKSTKLLSWKKWKNVLKANISWHELVLNVMTASILDANIVAGGKGRDSITGSIFNNSFVYCAGDDKDTYVLHGLANRLYLMGYSGQPSIDTKASSDNRYIYVTINGIDQITLDISNLFYPCIGVYQGSPLDSDLTPFDFITLKGEEEYPDDMEIPTFSQYACPVDVLVYDASGNLVQHLRDGEVSYVETEYGLFDVSLEDGEYVKTVVLYDDSYTVQALGVGDGVMKYKKVTLSDDMEDGQFCSVEEIPVEEGAIYHDSEDLEQAIFHVDTDADGVIDEVITFDTQAEFSQETYEVAYGTQQQLELEITTSSVDTECFWISSDDGVVTVDENGMITAVGFGEATILAMVADGSGAYDTCTVTVPEKTLSAEDFTVTGMEQTYAYTGKAIEVALEVSYGCLPLMPDVHYTADFSQLVEPGKATLTITGINDYSGTIEIPYEITAPKEPTTVEEKVDWIAAKCRTEGITDDWEIALWLHDWLVYNANYDYTYTHYSPYGVLMAGTGVCQSYADAYRLLLDEFSIENQVITSAEMDHAWNLVKLDGKWCHIDCTWDDPGIGGAENYIYFGMNDALMARDHVWPKGYPASTSKANYYYVRNDKNTATTVEEAQAVFAAQAKTQNPLVECIYIGEDADFLLMDEFDKWYGQYDWKYGIEMYEISGTSWGVTALISYTEPWEQPGEYIGVTDCPSFTLRGPEGVYPLAQYDENGVLLVFGRTNCGNTLALLEELNGRIGTLNAQGIQVLANLENTFVPGDFTEVRSWFPNITYTYSDELLQQRLLEMVDPGAQWLTYPLVFVINRDREIIYYSSGYVADIQVLLNRVKTAATNQKIPTPKPVDDNYYGSVFNYTGDKKALTKMIGQQLADRNPYIVVRDGTWSGAADSWNSETLAYAMFEALDACLKEYGPYMVPGEWTYYSEIQQVLICVEYPENVDDPTKPTEPGDSDKPNEPTVPEKPNKPTDPVYENPFEDVFEADYYYDPVLWAVNDGITNGMDATHFAPAGTCTRAQIVTFLWRANGSPEAEGNNPFTDVPSDAWYTNAVLWAVEEGITTGTSATTFSPDAGCTRGQVATFLWRSQGQPSVNGENIFTDIAPGAYYYDAVLWAVANGITNGMGEGLFAPDATCTRGQIVTFLYRAMNE